MKELSGSRKRRNCVGEVAIDEQGKEVSGEAAIAVWKTAFEKLGKQAEIKESFDKAHFEKIEREVNDIEKNNLGAGEDGLNGEILLEEVAQAVKKLKNGKASGFDNIVNEVIKYGGENVTRLIWRLCRRCFELEHIPQEWMKGVIFPIYKAGDCRDPNNYRGISLLSVVGKLYSSVLNRRLVDWSEKNNIILEEQGGFRPGRGCADQLFVLMSLLKGRRGKKTYCCFIDLRKAYDRVWRTGLWKRLWDEGVRGKVWRVLKNMYSNTPNCVLAGSEKTEFFGVDVGVRQGCVLSPLLF